MDITHYLQEKANEFARFESSLPKYMKIRDFLKMVIRQEAAFAGSKMPSTRTLALILNVSRSSVNKAYELLIYENFIESKAGSGHTIKGISSAESHIPLSDNSHSNYPPISDSGKNFLANTSIMNTSREISIAFRPGLPPLDIFPVNQWKKLHNLYWRNVKAANLNYSNVSGQDELKRHIAEYLYYIKGIRCHPEQVIIVSGSVQSLFLLGSSLINPQDQVVLENPTFPNVHAIFKSLQSTIHALDVDTEGVKISTLAPYASPKIIHVTPSCHYPTSTVMSIQRKHEILEYANTKGSIIIENDYEHEVNSWFSKSPSLFELDKQNRTVYLGTFNRLLHPSIRLGYMVLPTYLLNVVEAVQQHSHRFVSSANQLVMSEFIRKNHLLSHIKQVIEINQERKEIFIDYIRRHTEFPLEISNHGTNSLHTLYTYTIDIPDRKIINALQENDIIGHSYRKCFINEAQNGLIFGHSAIHRHLMPPKLNQLCKTLNHLLDNI